MSSDPMAAGIAIPGSLEEGKGVKGGMVLFIDKMNKNNFISYCLLHCYSYFFYSSGAIPFSNTSGHGPAGQTIVAGNVMHKLRTII